MVIVIHQSAHTQNALHYNEKKVKEGVATFFDSRNIKQNLENLFKHLNSLEEITSKEMYNEALKLFNVEIKKSGRGQIVLVTDGERNPIRYPMRLSEFRERPNFYFSERQEQREKMVNAKKHNVPDSETLNSGFIKAMVLKELSRQMQLHNQENQRSNKQKLKFRKKKGNKYRPYM